MEQFTGFRDLVVWQRGLDIVSGVYKLAAQLPTDERFGLVSQMRRSAFSIPANIAEGCARNNTGEFLLHVGYAIGSLAELETTLVIAEREHNVELAHELLKDVEETRKMLYGLKSSLMVRRQSQRRSAP